MLGCELVENPKYDEVEAEGAKNAEPDDLLFTASWTSLAHRRTTSLVTGKRWYEETSAAEEMEGLRSTMAVLKYLSIPCTIEG